MGVSPFFCLVVVGNNRIWLQWGGNRARIVWRVGGSGSEPVNLGIDPGGSWGVLWGFWSPIATR
jgi:hypothetical protein